MSAPEIINPPGGGGGGGTVTGTGTAGKLAKFATASSIGDSVVTELAGKIGINVVPGTLLSVGDGIVSPPSYDGIRLGNSSQALFSSSDSIRGFYAGVTGGTVVAGSTTSHDLLLQRAGVTGITLGASGAVAFAGNLTSSAAQTWTLATSTTALNVASGLLNLDTTNSRVGIGTASPIGTLDVRATNPTIVCSNSASRYGYSVWNDASSEFRTGTGGAHAFVLLTSNAERMRIDSSGNVGIGTASPAALLHVNGNAIGGAGASVTPYQQSLFGPSSAYTMWWKTSATAGGGLIGAAGPSIYFYVASGAPSAPTLLQVANFDSTGNFILGAATGVSIQAAGSQQGIKLPATPGNADTQVLDCYAEGTWSPTLSAAATWGGTQPTVGTARYVRIGSTVYCTVVLVGAPNFSSTYLSTTITAPFSATYNAAVPISSGATAFGCAQLNSGATTIFMPTFGVVGAATLSWTFIV